MPSNTVPSTARNNAWYDMVNSTRCERSEMQRAIKLITNHPHCKYVSYKYLFTVIYRNLMRNDCEIAAMPYNQAVLASRLRAAAAVHNILNNLAYTELLK